MPPLPADFDPDLDLVLTRTLDAPRDLVWACWTTPHHLAPWFVPAPHSIVACDLDARTGGRCDTTFRVDGQDMPNRGVYLEMDWGTRLVFTDTYTAGWKPAPEPFMTALVTLADAGPGRTAYTAVARHRSAAAATQHRDMGFHEGWGTVATQLEAYAQTLAARTMRIDRVIPARPARIWDAWADPGALPAWWGPDGFTCRTTRIDLRAGGEWVFDMIGPDGKAWPNHHRITRHDALRRIHYDLLWGEDGPRHAEARASFDDLGAEGTRVRLEMTFADQAQHDTALGFGAERLGQQTLAKLARHIGV